MYLNLSLKLWYKAFPSCIEGKSSTFKSVHFHLRFPYVFYKYEAIPQPVYSNLYHNRSIYSYSLTETFLYHN